MFFGLAKPHQKKPRKFCPHRHRHQYHKHHTTMPRPRVLQRKAANCPPSPSKNESKSPNAPPTGTPAPKIRWIMDKPPSTDPALADRPTTADPTSSEPAIADSTIFVPIAASAGSKKARAKKAATKQPINYMLLIRVTCDDKKIIEESSMECLQELESTFGYGKELQKQSAVVCSCQT